MKALFAFMVILFSFQISYALPAGWQEIKPGGETLCARGAEYKFLVRPGDAQKVVITFAGGGACWDGTTCSDEQVFTDTPEKTYGPVNNQGGVFDFRNMQNPYRKWTHVYVPYCTGDVHVGNSDANYVRSDKVPFVIHHRGATNVRAVLKWIQDNYKNASQVSVNGCSAGSYGSLVWSATLAENYKQARILQFGDSGAGVSNTIFFPQWGIEKSFPNWIPTLDPAKIDWAKLSIVDIYREIANHYPQTRFSQFNHKEDRVQILYYSAMGGNAADWTPRMLKSMEAIASAAPNFRYYVAPGNSHCSMTNTNFYTTKSDGVSLRRWLNRNIEGKSAENVKCLRCTKKIK